MAENPKIDREIRARYKGDMPPVLVGYRLSEPSHRKKASVIGVQLMGDLFHRDVTRDDIHRVFYQMTALARWHTFVVLTKRIGRAYRVLSDYDKVWDNIAIGTSVENQKTADERIPILLQIPARWHWVSYEPALDTVDFTKIELNSGCTFSAFEVSHIGRNLTVDEWPILDLVVAGCESGPKRRAANPDWFRFVRDQCQQAGVSFFFKQMEVDGKVVEMPELDGRVWNQLPWRQSE